jgi:DNA-directed RNA polymerase subunit beta'
VRNEDKQGERIETTVGRILFNEALPPQLRFCNKVIDKATLRDLTSECVRLLGNAATAVTLDDLKQLGFDYATKSGISIAMNDIEEPPAKSELLGEADKQISIIEDQFSHGLVTEDERYENAVQVWMKTTDKITEDVSQSLDRNGGIYMMATSGAKGNISQITQMVGMRGLMTDPSGRIIDFPIKSSFRDGLSPMEYFISTHGARKGLADTALRTSDAGYLTRRLVDVCQDVIIIEEDCGTTQGVWISEEPDRGSLPSFGERIIGYLAASRIVDPRTDEVIVDRNEEIDEERVKRIIEAGITRVYVRSPLSCQSRFGVCQHCYGRDLARRQLVKLGTAVGIIAAQSIGEPGTQLTLRTFHTGGVVGTDITSGLPRVVELFEARIPKCSAIISEIDGTAEITDIDGERTVKVTNSEFYLSEYPVPSGAKIVVTDGQLVDVGTTLFSLGASSTEEVEEQLPVMVGEQPGVARVAGQVIIEDSRLYIRYEEREEKEYVIPPGARLLVRSGSKVKAGEPLTEGVIAPQDILHISGREAVQQYLIDEIQKIYRFQGVNIHDKHISLVARKMLSKVKIISSGDTALLPGELISRFDYEDINVRVLAEGGEPATAQAVLLGITRVSLGKDSWLAAASFQESGHILASAAIMGKMDKLRGLKENVILGKLIPSRVLADEETEAMGLQLDTEAASLGETGYSEHLALSK